MSESRRSHTYASLRHLHRVGEHNAKPLHAASALVLDCVRVDGLVFTAGSGHSLAGVMESFYRAGGLAVVRPLHHPDLLPLNGATISTATERRPGFASGILENAAFPGGRDLLVVFSHSGINPYPVELAKNARARGSAVIAITSVAACVDAPKRANSTLAEQADVVLDTLVPAGDVSYPSDAPVTAPLSSLANAFLWNLLLARVYDDAEAASLELPWWRSSNTVGGDETNSTNLNRYGQRVPELR
jgi:uncharacterized phosphosugar-binding protein